MNQCFEVILVILESVDLRNCVIFFSILICFQPLYFRIYIRTKTENGAVILAMANKFILA